ncbi:hypothetical protein Palpr_0619 [Paludibacter propionicigenes WB4]|uniref:Uncharacterized protein n=1 Tax=Paludibacter propionicigenes (strain DSM 17365 / JCM 13257 / WB4) TaxID=694427 RepID=E4T231_PALPW|nr:hypothetical protein [Paludibacter propionicigenes]ADQ78775.1 hypothetical protein Palpr_0619 [Paludibacter propionicigenes WB4]
MKGHYLRRDLRIRVTKDIISPLQVKLDNIKEICSKDGYIYWDSIYADDTEHLVGTVFIVLQNYINSSISDLYPDLLKLSDKYSIDKKVNNSQTTRIELIIAIANYYKHRDSPSKLRSNTIKPLNDLKIAYKEIYDEQNEIYSHIVGSCSPVFEGLSLLSELWDFNDLINIVSDWRENMWLNEEKSPTLQVE